MRRALLPIAAIVCLSLLVWWRLSSPDSPETPRAPEDEPGHSVPADSSTVDPPPPAAPPYEGEDRVRVMGLVLDAASDEPIEGCRVTLQWPCGVWRAVTDATGGWRLDLPSVHRGSVDGGDNGWTYTCADHAAKGYVPYRTSIRNPAGLSELRVCEHLHRRRARVAGRVVDASGRAVAGARVMVSQRLHDEWRETDARGRFAPIDLSVGRHTIVAHAANRGRAAQSLLVLPTDTPKTIEIDVLLAAPRFAAGRIVDPAGKPLSGVHVRGDSKERGLSATTNEDGRFRWLLPLTDEPLWVWVEKESWAARESPHGLDPILGTTIVLHPAATLEGVVLTADGAPLPGVEVWACPPGERDVDATETDQDGRFRLGPLCPGPYLLQVKRDSIPLGQFERSIPAGGVHRDMVLRLPRLETWRGRATDALTGLPLEGVRVITRPGKGGLVTVSDEEGRFAFPFAADLVRTDFFYLERDGYVTRAAGTGTATVAMSPEGRIRMRVVDQAGRPLPATVAHVNPWFGGPAWWYPFLAIADASGRLEMEMQAVETREIEVRHRRALTRTLRVRPVPGTTTDLGDIRLERPKMHCFLVRDEEGRPVPDAYLTLPRGPQAIRADADGRILAPRMHEEWAAITAPGMTRAHRELHFAVEGNQVVVLERSGPIRGRVVDDLGEPVAGVEVHSGWLREHTDGRGRFALMGYRAGRQVFVAIDDGPVGGERAAGRWAVAGGEGITLTLPRPGRLRIECVGDRMPETLPDETKVWRIHPEQPDQEEGGPSVVFEHEEGFGGSYEADVRSGLLAVRFDPQGGHPRFWNEVRVKPGEETVLRYDFPSAGRVTGRVVDHRGMPIGLVKLVEVIGGATVAYSNLDGHLNVHMQAVFGVVPLLAIKEGLAPAFIGPVDLENGADILVRLSPGGTVCGRVYSPDGEPCALASVRIRSKETWVRHGPWERVRRGAFGILGPVAAGRQMLEVRVPERGPILREFDVEAGETTEIEIRLP